MEPALPALTRVRPRGGRPVSRRLAWRRLMAGLGLELATAAVLAGQSGTPTIRSLVVERRSDSGYFASVSSVFEYPGGSLLVNDISGRKLVLVDTAFLPVRVIADSTSATANGYGSRAGGLFRWSPDTATFADPTSLTLLLIDASGDVVRVMAMPTSLGEACFIGGPAGTPGRDAQGRLVCRAPQRSRPGARGSAALIAVPVYDDTAALVRFDLPTRTRDTLTFVRVPKRQMKLTRDESGGMVLAPVIDPLPLVDDWAVLPNGTVAVIRGASYAIEWLGSGGGGRPPAKLPIQWARLSEERKIEFLDSTRAALERLRDQANRTRVGIARAATDRAAADPSRPGRLTVFRPDAAADPEAMARGVGGRLAPIQLIPATELPDYAPPFSPGSVLADYAGNVWIRTWRVVSGGSIYDVVSQSGTVVARAAVPSGRVVVGFGRGGAVYLAMRDPGGSVRLEKATFDPRTVLPSPP